MRILTAVAAVVLWPAIAGPGATAAAGERACMCQSTDGPHAEGSLACLTINGRQQLARCVKVLNNTSWKVIGDSCPLAAAVSPAPQEHTPASPSAPSRPGA